MISHTSYIALLHLHGDWVVYLDSCARLKDDAGMLVEPVGRHEGDAEHDDAEGEDALVKSRAALQEHSRPDSLPDGLGPGGELRGLLAPVLPLVLCSAPSVPQPVVQPRRSPLLGPSPG